MITACQWHRELLAEVGAKAGAGPCGLCADEPQDGDEVRLAIPSAASHAFPPIDDRQGGMVVGRRRIAGGATVLQVWWLACGRTIEVPLRDLRRSR